MGKILQNKKLFIHFVIIAFFFFIFPLLPPFLTLTRVGMQILGIFIGCIYGWCTCDIIVVSLCALLRLGFLEGNTITSIFSAAFGNATVQIMFFAMVFCYAVMQTGLMEYIAKWMLSLKIVLKGPWSLACVLWTTSTVLAALITTVMPPCLFLWALFYDICKEIKLEKDTAYVCIVLIGICVCAYAGSGIFPYGVSAQMGLGLLKTVYPEAALNYIFYMTFMILFNVLLIVALVIFFKFFMRIKVNYVIPQTLMNLKRGALTAIQKVVACYMIIAILVLILPGFLPQGVLKNILSNFGVTGTFAMIACIMVYTEINGEKALSIGNAIRSGISYETLFLVGTALTISPFVSSADAGIVPMVNTLLDPVFSGKEAIVCMTLFIIVGVVLTNCINNVVCMTLLIPISYLYISAANGNPMLMLYVLLIALMQGVATPMGSAMGALLHGNTEWMSTKNVYKYATIMEAVLIVALCVAATIGQLLFNI